MVERVWFVGSNEVTAPQIEAGFLEHAGIARQSSRDAGPICSAAGRRSAISGCGGRFYELWTDPTAGALIGGGAPHVLDWMQRMLWPTGRRRLRDLVDAGADPDADPDRAGRRQFMPWTLANEKALAEAQGRVQRRARRQGLDPEAAKISRALARHAARQIRRGAPTRPHSIRCWTRPGCLAGLRG